MLDSVAVVKSGKETRRFAPCCHESFYCAGEEEDLDGKDDAEGEKRHLTVLETCFE